MENIYLILVVALFALAVSDLIVGVGNDAVNFLNTAIGSKAGSMKLILLVSAIGVFIGAAFSEGMMEVARKGIFNPQHFYFNEIIFIFLAVMITDVLLLDFFNTIGFPTSTTVSIVFELLGAAVAIALVKIYNNPDLSLDTFINSSKTLEIISGILLSIVFAFISGAVFQYLTRVIFSFKYEKTLKYFGSIFCSIAVTIIIQFILLKGAKESTLLTKEMASYIKMNSFYIQSVTFVSFALLFQLLLSFTRVNILKIVVLFGTFALALAFAGNDLVNFIGVPLAGYESFVIWKQSLASPDNLLMVNLDGKITTNPLFLILAGLIMILTLLFSKKARGVTRTSVDLSRQDEGHERFGSSAFARSMVRTSRNISSIIDRLMPQKVSDWLESRFELPKRSRNEEGASFDLLRASVILIVSSALISIATSNKLPLSTTYVTFMVAMGASLADRAWGRESAVYRITGVISIVGGWFITAASAFFISFIVALVISKTEFIGIGAFLIITLFILYRTHSAFKKKEQSNAANTNENISEELDSFKIIEKCKTSATETLSTVSENYSKIITGLITEDRKILKNSVTEINELNIRTKSLKNNLSITIHQLKEDAIENGHYYVQVTDYLREITHCITFISNPAFKHVDNQHKALIPVQVEEVNYLSENVEQFFKSVQEVITHNRYQDFDEILTKQQILINYISSIKKKQVKRIKKEEVGTRNSMLYMELMTETKNLLLFTVNMLKSQRDFTSH